MINWYNALKPTEDTFQIKISELRMLAFKQAMLDKAPSLRISIGYDDLHKELIFKPIKEGGRKITKNIKSTGGAMFLGGMLMRYLKEHVPYGIYQMVWDQEKAYFVGKLIKE